MFVFLTGLSLFCFLTGNILTLNHQQVGRWVKGVSAGGCRNSSSYISNPKFWLKVCTRGEILVSLLQHSNTKNTEKYARTPLSDRKSTKYQNYQAIALHMWKVCSVVHMKFICIILSKTDMLECFLRWKRSI